MEILSCEMPNSAIVLALDSGCSCPTWNQGYFSEEISWFDCFHNALVLLEVSYHYFAFASGDEIEVFGVVSLYDYVNLCDEVSSDEINKLFIICKDLVLADELSKNKIHHFDSQAWRYHVQKQL